MKKFPKFQKAVRIVYDEKVVDGNFNSNSGVHRTGPSDENSEYSSLSQSELIERLEDYDVSEEEVDPDGLPF